MSPLGRLLLTHCSNDLDVDLQVILSKFASWQLASVDLLPKIKCVAIHLGMRILGGS